MFSSEASFVLCTKLVLLGPCVQLLCCCRTACEQRRSLSFIFVKNTLANLCFVSQHVSDRFVLKLTVLGRRGS